MSRYQGTVGEPRVIPCPSWCVYQDPSDEACHSTERRVPATRYHRDRYGDDDWADAYFTTYATFSRLGPRHHLVHLGLGEATGFELTADEARQLAEALILAAADLEAATGGEQA
ncbi:hypothetical protein ATK17_1617 [Branchiibius hedensis]|uniref:Uncharacterized protein n=1 Tax=Branchiibius hedensis TaxID=672460 RepID=A0A2Y9C1G9_9MICO|nr:hypothetical protein [Branchiibius hedensis]PWJ25490.1 hypothetical protein ATK17_1617 [Branchiibius hedensis]SSA34303.1 hypothetical protein SAMN04489750_1617 [Branchiibius hedensis]